MKLRHIRNATAIIELGEHVLLVDPMLSEVGAMPGFKMFGGGRRDNPLVPLPEGTDGWLDRVTGVIVTHEHPDHLDRPGLAWIEARGLPVWASPTDAPNLRRKGLDVYPLVDGALGARVEVVPARHGRGLLGWLMGPVSGLYLAHPDAPSLLLTSDATLTDALLATVDRLRPDVVVAPAGAANMGLGGDILFSVDELVTLAHRAPGVVVLNHLEALDHCPTTRAALAERMRAEGLAARVRIPADGELLTLDRAGTGPHASPAAVTAPAPGFQKWLTARFAGT